MSRKKTEINPISAERLKIIIEESGLTQIEFGKRVNYSQQHISGIINKTTALTPEFAKRVVKVFPRYEEGWLMGYENDKTQSDRFYNAILKAEEENMLLHSGFFSFAKLAGFDIEVPSIDSDEDIEQITPSLEAYCTISRDGKSVTFSIDDLNTFENELCDYVEFRLTHLMK